MGARDVLRAARPVKRHLALAFFGPPDWLIGKVSARTRRAFGFWTVILAVMGAFIWGRAVLYVTVLSVVALIPNFSSETPVEVEEGD